MAENNQQGGVQNKLGELFVEFSTKGLPTLLKNLNSVQAGFLLGKNAATQFAQVLSQPVRQATEGVVGLRKFSNELGLSFDRLQSMQAWAKKYGISNAIFGDMAKIIDTLTIFRKYNRLPSEWLEAARLLNQAGGINLDFTKYKSDAEGATQLLNDIGIGFKRISDIGLKRSIVQNLGLSIESLDYLKQGIINYQEITNLSEKENELLLEQKKAIGELDNAWSKFMDRLAAKASTILIPILEQATDMLTPAENNSFDVRAKKTAMWSAIVSGAMAGGMVGSVATPVGTTIGAVVGGIGGYQVYKQVYKHSAKQQKTKQQNKPPKNILQEPVPKIDETPLFKSMPELDVLGESDLNNYGTGNSTIMQGATVPPNNLLSYNTTSNQDVNINVYETQDSKQTARDINNVLIEQARLNGIQYRNQATV